MTLEDFKAVRDVDVASNTAQFTEIKADLESLVRTSDIKEALLACLENVGWKDNDSAERYIYNLETALDGGEDEFYNVYERSIAGGSVMFISGPSTIDNATGDIWINLDNTTMAKRRKVLTTNKGKKSYVNYTSREPIGVYPVPVPKDAISCTVTANNSSYLIGADMFKFDKIANKYSGVSGGKVAAAGPMELTFSASPNKFLGIVLSRPNNADFATGEPSAVSIIFHREGE